MRRQVAARRALQEKSQDSQRAQQSQTLGEAAKEAIEEARMVLPGIQALFGFQLIAVFNARFTELSPADQLVHFAAVLLVAIAIALIMTPAAYHRQVELGSVSDFFIKLASMLIAVAMVSAAPLNINGPPGFLRAGLIVGTGFAQGAPGPDYFLALLLVLLTTLLLVFVLLVLLVGTAALASLLILASALLATLLTALTLLLLVLLVCLVLVVCHGEYSYVHQGPTEQDELSSRTPGFVVT
jgi:DMSO reductase anchor subunit